MAQQPMKLDGKEYFATLINEKPALEIADAQAYMGYESRRGFDKMLLRNGIKPWKPKTGGRARYVLLEDLQKLKEFEVDEEYSYSSQKGDEDE